MSSTCDNSQIVAVPGLGFIPACIQNNIETQFQVSVSPFIGQMREVFWSWLIIHSEPSTLPNIVIMLHTTT